MTLSRHWKEGHSIKGYTISRLEEMAKRGEVERGLDPTYEDGDIIGVRRFYRLPQRRYITKEEAIRLIKKEVKLLLKRK